jgi:hypothetical protein
MDTIKWKSLNFCAVCHYVFLSWAVTLFNLNQSRGTWMGNMCSGVHVGRRVSMYYIYSCLWVTHYNVVVTVSVDTWHLMHFFILNFYLPLTTVYISYHKPSMSMWLFSTVKSPHCICISVYYSKQNHIKDERAQVNEWIWSYHIIRHWSTYFE